MRDSTSVPVTNFYVVFREWMNVNFPALDDVLWSRLLEEDENIDYSEVGSGRVYEDDEEITIGRSVEVNDSATD